jgi:hypothetical protein
MPKMELLSYFLRIERCNLTKMEKSLLEIKLFFHVYRELCEVFKYQYKDYKRLIPFNHYQEQNMFCINFTQEMIKDILSTEEYSLKGIANHTHIPEEVLSDVASGMNSNPTLELSRKLFELHMIVRRDLYRKIIDKILSEHLSQRLLVDDKH